MLEKVPILSLALVCFGSSFAAPLSEEEVDESYLAAPISITLQSVPPRPANSALPTPLRQPLPEYPMEMRKIGAEGEVLFKVRVDTNGTVISCEVTKATNHVFESSAREAAMHWSFLSRSPASAVVIGQMAYVVKFHIDLDRSP